ncbi:MAG: hypothetical protein C0613_13965 [Desulfobulbaceae bacterium]|nr:MAG: hypothetical protein C0613_13965 [Desulfobulbaceae bacterium]
MKTKRKNVGRAVLLPVMMGLMVLVLGGCAAPRLDLSFDAPLAEECPGLVVSPPVRIGVEPFVDMRPQVHGSDNQKWKGLIPGILWLEIGSDIPEIYTAFSSFSSKPMNYTVALAVADILAECRAAQDVFFIPHNNHSDYDYRLEGSLQRSLVHETGYYYGSFMYAWLTRVIGLPYVSYGFELEVELKLRKVATDEIVWRTRLSGTAEDKYYNVYSLSRGKDGKDIIAWNFAQILTPEVVKSIAALQRALP